MTNVTATLADERSANRASDGLSRISRLKGGGYLTSTASVVLLAAPALKSALESSFMLACLIAGMLASIAGMLLRWRSHQLEQKENGD